MSGTKTRKVHSADFKAKVALEAVREGKTLNELSQAFGVHPVPISQWKKELLQRASERFEGQRGPPPVTEHSAPERLYGEIGRLKMELDWLKKKSGLSLSR
jgi:transposase-like protein